VWELIGIIDVKRKNPKGFYLFKITMINIFLLFLFTTSLPFTISRIQLLEKGGLL